MGGPPSLLPASTSGSSAPVRRCSARRVQRRGGGHQQPPPTSPPPCAAVSPSGTGLRRSARNRVRGLPSATPSSERRRRMSPKPLPRPRPRIEAAAEQWSNGKVLSGARKEECVLPFIRKGAPRKDAGPADDIEEAFRRLPLPYTNQEFNIYPIKKEGLESVTEPPPYVHLKHNIYLVKKKCDGNATECGCTNCDPPLTCNIRCSCRSALISCSRACHCSSNCTNRPFRREKQVKIVKTQHCGWGVIAQETIGKGEFVIEFVGEVIDGVKCEERLKDTKRRADKNLYMCEVSNDFVIDATFRGNACRFLNHSCRPNCQLEKWLVNGKTRLGVFASQAIEVGEPLTYNYRFKQRFGPRIECFCGAADCKGNL